MPRPPASPTQRVILLGRKREGAQANLKQTWCEQMVLIPKSTHAPKFGSSQEAQTHEMVVWVWTVISWSWFAQTGMNFSATVWNVKFNYTRVKTCHNWMQVKARRWICSISGTSTSRLIFTYQILTDSRNTKNLGQERKIMSTFWKTYVHIESQSKLLNIIKGKKKANWRTLIRKGNIFVIWGV